MAGLTALQIGRQGWGFQKSQNDGGTVPPPSFYSAPYHRYGSRVETSAKENSFYDGIDISIGGIASLATGGDAQFLKEGLARLAQCVETASDHYRPEQSAGIAVTLAEGLESTRKLLEQVRASDLSEPGKSDIGFELERKTEQFEQALTLALGLSFQATVAPDKEPTGPFRAFGGTPITFTIAIPGQHFAIQTHLLNAGAKALNVRSLTISASDGKRLEDFGTERRARRSGRSKRYRAALRSYSPG